MNDTQGDVAEESTDSKPRKRKPLWRRLLSSVVRIGVIAYVGLCLVLTSCQSRIMYQPSREMDATPSSVGLAFEEVRFRTDDGVNLFGWYIPAEDSRGVILICHGNAGNISGRLYTISSFHDLGLDVFIFDYRGYGLSEGEPSEQGTYWDVEAAWRHLTETRSVQPDRILVFGRSLGGAIAAYLASRQPAAGLVLESTFSSAVDVGRHYYPLLPIRWLLKYRYPTAEYVQSVDCPILVIHSPDDDIIPYELGRKVFDAAHEPKKFLQIEGGHNEAFFVSQRDYRLAMTALMDRTLGQ